MIEKRRNHSRVKSTHQGVLCVAVVLVAVGVVTVAVVTVTVVTMLSMTLHKPNSLSRLATQKGTFLIKKRRAEPLTIRILWLVKRRGSAIVPSRRV